MTQPNQTDFRFLKTNATDFENGGSNDLRLKGTYRTAIGKAHDQNSDTKLANGTANEVTAADLRAFLDSKAQNSGLASLDSSGKIPSSQLPAIAITSAVAVADITERNALTAQEGDVAIVTDSGDGSSKSYIKNAAGNWLEIKSPTGGVGTVNGQSGTVVLDAGDIAITTPSGWTAEQLQEFVDEVASKFADLAAADVSFDDTALQTVVEGNTVQAVIVSMDSLLGAMGTDITNAQTAADDAASAASAAQSAADAAQSTATGASTDAASAVTTANSASSTATSASTAAAAAQTAAENAATAATNAATAATAAQSTADDAQSDATSALTKAGTLLFPEDPITLSSAQITAKKVQLTHVPVDANKVRLNVNAGGFQRASTDFGLINGSELTWSGLTLENVLVEGDVLYVAYPHA